MQEQQLEVLLKDLRDSPNSFSKQKELLKLLRSSKIRRSDLVQEFGTKVLEKKSSLGSEVWIVIEQVLLARLDVGDIEGAKKLYFELKHQFGKESVRVQTLLGMMYEANGELDQARKFYKSFHSKQPMNQLIYKRRICVEKALGCWDNAIKLLSKYVQIHTVDSNAWEELGELHIKQNNFKEASFCYEELILLEPENFHYHTALAEVLYTIGGMDNLVTARNYYAHSLTLNKDQNLRSLFGLHTVTSTIASLKNGKTQENAKLLAWASAALQDCYKGNAIESTVQEFTTK